MSGSVAIPKARAVCILGMHRSGTSLVSRILNLLGVFLGPDNHLMRPAPGNPKGHWEHERLTRINDRILERLGGSWHEPPVFHPGWERGESLADLRAEARALLHEDFGQAALWGWKDPRNSLTLPFWQRLVPAEMCHVICLRNPIDVARSLERRDDFAIDKGIRLWLKYTTSALRHTAGHPRLLIFYEDVMQRSRDALPVLAKFVGARARAGRAELRRAVAEFMDRELHHHNTPVVDAVDDPNVVFPAKSLYLVLRTAMSLPPDAWQRGASELDEALTLFGERAQGALTQKDTSVHDLAASRDAAVALEEAAEQVRKDLAERGQLLAGLQEALAERDRALGGLRAELGDSEATAASLRERLVRQEQEASVIRGQDLEQVRLLRAQLGDSEATVASLRERVVRQESEIICHLVSANVEPLANDLVRLLAAFRRTRTWWLANLLRRIWRFHLRSVPPTVLDPLVSLAVELENLSATRPPEPDKIRQAISAIRIRLAELGSSRSLLMARKLTSLVYALRFKRPGPGAIDRVFLIGELLLTAHNSMEVLRSYSVEESGLSNIALANGLATASKRALTDSGLPPFSRSGQSTADGTDRLPREVMDNGVYRRFYEDLLVHSERSENSESFVPFKSNEPVRGGVKVIAFFLPQFHPIPENDRNWGRGFTEWTNVTKAVPQFLGHYQPHLPIDVGFYDLRVVETLKRQAELARNYGIYGFCFHHYWFNGRAVLRTPIDLLLQHREIDINYCLNWANENWTRTWDGLNDEVLIQQNHSAEDDLAFIRDAEKYLRDSRYIRVQGKPLLVVYRPLLFPDPRRTTKLWRNYCTGAGIGDLYLVSTHAFDSCDPREIGFDAVIEYAPNNFPLEELTKSVVMLNPDFTGKVLSYESAVELVKQYRLPNYKKFRGVCPSWDNEPRRPGRGTVLFGATPEKYKAWIEYACLFTERHFGNDEQLLFVNAWNEWAEGAHLEPDRKYGYAYLQATYDVLKSIEYVQSIEHAILPNEKRSSIGVICHLYYADLWEEIERYLANLGESFDLYVSMPRGTQNGSRTVLSVKRRFPNAVIYRCENRGRDILPFLKILRLLLDVRKLSYKYLLKIHSKKSPHRADGDLMRAKMFERLIGSREGIRRILESFESNASVGIVAPNEYIFPVREHWGSNYEKVVQLAHELGVSRADDFDFVAGTMFWFRPDALTPLLRLRLEDSDFADEQGQTDGEINHAVERLMIASATIAGYRTIGI